MRAPVGDEELPERPSRCKEGRPNPLERSLALGRRRVPQMKPDMGSRPRPLRKGTPRVFRALCFRGEVLG